MKRVLVVVLVCLFSLAGCGAGDGGGSAPKYANLDRLANAICKVVEPDADPALYVRESDTCQLMKPARGRVTVLWFNDNGARDAYVKAGRHFGGIYVIGDKWAVECDRSEQQATVMKMTDGKAA